jgi:hypothetical protein
MLMAPILGLFLEENDKICTTEYETLKSKPAEL